MSVYERENQYLRLLSEREHTVKELSEKLFVSEPTVRRDIVALSKKELVTCRRARVSLRVHLPDRRIPLSLRDLEKNEEKRRIAARAAECVKDGDVIMLDATTTAMHMLEYLEGFRNILVITNGAKTAIEAATRGIRTLCTGGELAPDAFCYIGPDAEAMLRRYNADVAFFSCRGISDAGIATDTSVLENNMRSIMIKNAKKSYLLCDKSKMGKTYLHSLVSVDDIDGVITD